MLHKLYFALIHPHISYGILSWGNAGKTVLQKTTTLQKRAIRMINKKSYNSHTDPLFRSSKIQDLYSYQSAIFMFDYTIKKCPTRLTPFSHIITKSKVCDLQDNLDCCTYHVVCQIVQVNFLFTCYHQFG